ncbi:MAG: hypothetical protein FKY71_19895 [Spiribacter salinus]|uniref:Uncharacterized protein n=1 Tax=Spiribacter salinus TaxID=1335746 RepID=A0A540V742_9GAMM|nr:MAG: hypothetical protein FKY71_19895 [Spiribacter salinus]
MQRHVTLYVGNDHSISFTGDGALKDQDGNTISGADVEMTLLQDGTEVAGETWPVPLSDDGGGEYSAILSSTVDIQDRQRYVLRIEAEAGGTIARWDQEVLARRRPFAR